MLRTWSLPDGALVQSLPIEGGIAVSKDGTKVLTQTNESGNSIIDATTGKTILRYLRMIAKYGEFVTDGSHFVGVSENGLKLYASESGRSVQSFVGLTHRVMGASISSNGRFLATGGGVISLWDLEIGRQIRTFGFSGAENATAISLSPDAHEVLIGTMNGDLRRWITSKGGEVLINPINVRSDAKSLSYSADGHDWLVQTYYLGTLLFKHDGYGNPAGALQFKDSQGYASAFSPDGHLVVTPSSMTNAAIWQAASGKKVNTLRHPTKAALRSVAFSPNGRLVATGSYDGSARLWDVARGKLLTTFKRHSNPVTSIAISRDNRFLLTASGFMSGGDNTARLWDAKSGRELKVYAGHSAAIRTVKFLEGKGIILTASEDGSVKLWQEKSGRELCSVFSLADSHWMVITPYGHFDTDSLDDMRLGQFIVDRGDLSVIPLERLLPYKYEPGLLARILKGETFRPESLPVAVESLQYAASILGFQYNEIEDTVTMTVRVTPDNDRRMLQSSNDTLADVRLFRDGQLVGIQHPAITSTESTAPLRPAAVSDLVFRNIRLPEADNQRRIAFSAYAMNGARIKGRTSHLIITVPPSRPKPERTAYLLSIGVSEYTTSAPSLHWAAADARALVETLSGLLKDSGQYDRVVTVTLTSEQGVASTRPTKGVIRSLLAVLAGTQTSDDLETLKNINELRRLGPNDVLVISFSGHGYKSADGRYFLFPFEGSEPARIRPDENSLLAKAISTDDLEEWFRDLDAGNITLIIDACHSGAAFQSAGFKPGPMGSRGLGQLAFDKGIQILAASQSDGVAIESSAKKMGLLTYVLTKDAIAFASTDHAIDDMSLHEWLDFGVEHVPTLYRAIVPGTKKVRSRALEIEARDVTVESVPTPKLSDSIQQPALFDYSQKSRDIPWIPGFRLRYRQAGETALAAAYKAESQGGSSLGDALKQYDEAADWFREAEDDYRWADTLRHAASIWRSEGKTSEAVENLKLAVFLAGRAGATRARAYALADLAEIELAQSNPQKALDYLSQALEMAASDGDIKEYDDLLRRIAAIYDQAGETGIELEYKRLISSAYALDR